MNLTLNAVMKIPPNIMHQLHEQCLTSDQLGTGILIDLGHIDDCAGLLGIAQSA